MAKGFITMAAGDAYCRLAEHLYMSYKLFSGCEYPFYVITDKEGEERLSKLFDGVIVIDLQRNTVDKLMFLKETPFDETIFIDADSSVVNDLNYVFDLFEKNGSDISAISRTVPLKDGEDGVQFSASAAKELGITQDFPKFNGGVYYYRKSEAAQECIDFMFRDALPNYHHYGLLTDKTLVKYDEPIFIISMLKYGMKTLPVESNIMFLLFEKHDKVRWDMNKRVCFYPWDGMIVSPLIIHWKFGGTETFQYEKYDARIKGRYLKWNRMQVTKEIMLSFTKYNIYPKLLKVFPFLHKAVADRK